MKKNRTMKIPKKTFADAKNTSGIATDVCCEVNTTPQIVNVAELQCADPCVPIITDDLANPAVTHQYEVCNTNDQTNSVSNKINELISDRDDWKNQYVRIKADFENYRKRESERVARAEASSRELLVEALLPVYDSLNRALDLCRPDANIDGLKTGLDQAYKLFQQVLVNNGVQIVGEVNEIFDPALHNAITKDDNIPSGEYTEIIAQVYQPGVVVNGRPFKPAMVKVGYLPRPNDEQVDIESNDTKSDIDSVNNAE